MALEDLVRRHDQQTQTSAGTADGAALRKGSLIRQAAELAGQTLPPEEPAAAAAVPAGEDEPQICADGYVRRSPVQPYCTAEDYNKRRLRRILGAAALAVLAVLLAIALVRAGLLRFR